MQGKIYFLIFMNLKFILSNGIRIKLIDNIIKNNKYNKKITYVICI